jgi:hypothetical protein
MAVRWSRHATVVLLSCWLTLACAVVTWAQGFPQSAAGGVAPAAEPSSGEQPGEPPPAERPRYVQVVDNASPPASQGQVWREYDLRPYLTRVRGMEHPQRPVVEWILRETGTENWLGEVPGMLSFEGDRLRVYHLPEVQDVVARIVDRFVNPELSKYAVGVRLITVENTAWRAAAMPLMEPVRVETPGVQAWTLSRENAARLGAQLRSLMEYRVHNSENVQIGHAQTHVIERWQPHSYPERLQVTPTNYPGYQVLMGQIQEGFSLELSPLAMSDGSLMEVVVKCQADQIERMTPVSLDVPTGNTLFGRVQIEVPQVSSWRVHERFRWPPDQVLVISRGMVAMPGLHADNSVTLPSLLTGAPARADALLVLDCKEAPAGTTGDGPETAGTSRVNYQGRY